MIDNKNMSVDNVESISKKMNGVDWRMKWKEYLKESVLNDNKNCMLNLNVDKEEMKGVCKRGEEVIEVKENENEVELMIVNVLNHSMIVLKGLKGEELNEMDLSELIENEIVDLNDDGMRWEGEVLKGDLFGYGCLYDEENELEYEGWMIEGKKRCYGIEYWNDIGLKKYCGCYYDGLKNGYGLLYDRNGMIEYEGLFKDDVVIDVNDDMRMKWIDDCELIVTSCIESLIIDDDFNPDISSLILNYSLISLKRIEIGDDCFDKVNRFVIDGLNELERVIIGQNSFLLDENNREGSKCLIMNCDQLSEIHIEDWSFFWYESFELKNLPSLISIQLDDNAFWLYHSVVFENLIRLQSITLGSWTLDGYSNTVESNELIMKNLPSLSLFKGEDQNFQGIGKVILENIPSLTDDGIQMGENALGLVNELTSSNADSLDRFIRQNSYYLLKIDEGDNKSATKRFEYGCSHDLSVFDIDCLKGIERLEIGNDCFEKVNRFEIDGLNELETIIIRQNCFFLDNNNREGSKCVIMNCDHLKVIHTGRDSFYWYESLELKNLPSLIFIQLDDNAFTECHSVVFENLPRLQFITLGRGTLFGDKDTVKSNLLIMRNLIQSMANGTFDGDSFMIEWNELIMKNLPSLSLFKGEDQNFQGIGKVILENIPSLTDDGIQMNGDSFIGVKELHSSNADSLDRFIQQKSFYL
ncbi:hypothetical protein WA171_002482 [Blastocystis sp. BT1]